MGRKSTKKARKINHSKKQEWANQLFSFFQENGLEGITMDKMAKYLEKSKSTLYEYFQSKEEIIQLGLMAKIGSIEVYEQILSNNSLSYKERYQQFFTLLSSSISDISNRFLIDLRQSFPEEWKMIEAFLVEMLRRLEIYYKGGIESGQFRKINIPLLLEVDKNFIFGVLTNPEFLKEQQLTLKELIEDYLTLKLDGLGN